MNAMIKLLSSALIALVFYIVSVPAFAQSCSGPVCSANPPTGSACRVFFSNNNGRGTQAPGQADEPAGCYDPSRVYGLQGWHFNAPDGREISRASLRQDEDGLAFAFGDADGGEPVQGFAWLVPLPEGTEPLTVNASGCAGICRVSLGQMPLNSTFVLLGFDFERTSNDGAIQTIAVGPILRSPTGIGALTVDFRDVEFAYRAIVHYALVPSSELNGPLSTGGNYSGGSAALVGMSNPGNAVLTGFSFKFTGGSQQLEDFGLELGGLGFEAWYQNREDEANRRKPANPFEWHADYVILQ